MNLSESQLQNYVRCPLTQLSGFAEPVFGRIMLEAVRTAMAQSLSRPMDSTVPSFRNLLSARWSQYRHKQADGEYYKGHRNIPFIAKRIADTLRDYQIVVPVLPYSLVLEEGQIDVEYAIARPWRKDAPWLVFNLRRSKAPQYHQYPDFVALARWLHLQTRERFKDIQILHVPVLNGKAWIERDLSKPLVRRQLNTILRAARERDQFGRVGPHCETCCSRRCLNETHEL
jgi:hypothetical protein